MNPGTLFRSLSPLQLALGLSVAVHAALLTVRIVDPERFERIFQDTPLEVILVNARSEEAPPDKAQAIAQSTLAGGGGADTGRASSPLPSSALTDIGEAMEETQRRVDAMVQQQNQLLAQVRGQLAALPRTDPSQADATPEQAEQKKQRRQLVKLLAEIERRINEENARPRKRYISPATREAVYALYYDALRHKIEELGTANFPQSSSGRKLYGELIMTITVNWDGRVLRTEVVASSGNRSLDRQARTIARAAAPFGPFSSAMRRQADEIVVVSRFKFTRDETLETQFSAAP